MWKNPENLLNSDKYLPVRHKWNEDTLTYATNQPTFCNYDQRPIFHLQPFMPSLMPLDQYRACAPIHPPDEGIYISMPHCLRLYKPDIGVKKQEWSESF